MNTTPDPTRDALYAAILDHPDEDTPRLVYADYLDEHGDSHRAEFIRLQCRLARMKEWDEGFAATDVRCQRLLTEHPEWLDPIRPFTTIRDFRSQWDVPPFVRGFAEQVELPLDRFLEVHQELFASFPVRSARLLGPGQPWGANAATCDRLASCPDLARLRNLDVNVEENSLAQFATIPHLKKIERLTVRTGSVDPNALRALVESPNLRGLGSFRLHNPGMFGQTAVADQVDRWKWFENLREMELNGTYFGGFITRLIDKAGWLPQLERLRFGHYNPEGERATIKAMKAGQLPALQELELACIASHPAQLQVLATVDSPGLASFQLPGVQSWYVEPNEDPTDGIFQAGFLRNLRRLGMNGSNLSDFWLESIADAPCRRTLRSLNLTASKFTSTGFRSAFAHNRDWPELEVLNLQGVDCPDDVLAGLVDHPGMPKLVALLVGQRQPSPKLLERLADSPSSARFRDLQLFVQMDDASANALARSPHLENLDRLIVIKGTAGRTPVNRLKRRFGSRLTIEPNRR